ncbi:putative transcription repressor NiaR [Methylomusa anaerophila]|uniref:Putative transcription repressor NiaR n=1 Tax=Methylomusa anaerophila TaxID=1930071 RepID=A0A348AG29_9FIRM|nr:putative transcription repressor NiaR [Methylomusa anaerophila]
MDTKERREQLLQLLKQSQVPLTGTALANKLGVSRQVIVGDIAILRAAGVNVYATPLGYVIPVLQSTAVTTHFACRHGRDRMGEELAIIIDNGGKVLNVIVDHPVYGEIKASLMLSSRRELADFLRDSANSGAEPLSVITGGVHLHMVEASSEVILQKIEQELRTAGILVE